MSVTLCEPYTYNSFGGITSLRKIIGATNPKNSMGALDLFSMQGMLSKNLGKLQWQLFNSDSSYTQVLLKDTLYILNFNITLNFANKGIFRPFCSRDYVVYTPMTFEGFIYMYAPFANVKIENSENPCVFNIAYQYSFGEPRPQWLTHVACPSNEYDLALQGSGRKSLLNLGDTVGFVVNSLYPETTEFRANGSGQFEISLKSAYAPIADNDTVVIMATVSGSRYPIMRVGPTSYSYKRFKSCGLFFKYLSGLKVNAPCIIGFTSRLVKETA